MCCPPECGMLNLLRVQVQIADLRVAHVDDAHPVAHVRACPQFPESLTGGGQFVDQRPQARIVGISCPPLHAARSPRRRSLRPNPRRARGRQAPTAASAGSSAQGKTRRQRASERIGRQHIQASAGHDRRHRKLIDQLAACRRRRASTPAISALAARRTGELVQILGGLDVELQRPRQRVEHLGRRVLVAALLEPQVVVGADAGQQSPVPRGASPQPVAARRPPARHLRARTCSRRPAGNRRARWPSPPPPEPNPVPATPRINAACPPRGSAAHSVDVDTTSEPATKRRVKCSDKMSSSPPRAA